MRELINLTKYHICRLKYFLKINFIIQSLVIIHEHYLSMHFYQGKNGRIKEKASGKTINFIYSIFLRNLT